MFTIIIHPLLLLPGHQRGDRCVGEHEIHRDQVPQGHPGERLHLGSCRRDPADAGRQRYESAEHVSVTVHRTVPCGGATVGEEFVADFRSFGGEWMCLIPPAPPPPLVAWSYLLCRVWQSGVEVCGIWQKSIWILGKDFTNWDNALHILIRRIYLAFRQSAGENGFSVSPWISVPSNLVFMWKMDNVFVT